MRIYEIPPPSGRDDDAEDALLARAARLGFDHVLVSGNDAAPPDLPQLSDLCRRCGAHGLACLLDVGTTGAPHATDSGAGFAAWEVRFVAQLDILLKAGVAGFRFLHPARLPAQAWARIFAMVRDAGAHHVPCLAWAPGLTPQQLLELTEAGFDSVFCSLPWWDFRSVWLAEELARLRPLGRIAAPMALPGELPDDALAARRALWAAAGIGDDILMPAGFETGAQEDNITPYDLTHEVIHANAWHAANRCEPPCRLRMLTGQAAVLTVLARLPAYGSGALAIVINPDLHAAATLGADRILGALPEAAGHLLPASGGPGMADDTRLDATAHLTLAPGDIRFLRTVQDAAVGMAVRKRLQHSVEAAVQAPRIAIENVAPQCDAGRFAVRRIVGQQVKVSADVWMDGHDQLAVMLLWHAPGEETWHEVPMTHAGNDVWTGSFPLLGLGRHTFTVEAWRDPYATWRDEVTKKRQAGVDVTLETEEGAQLVLTASTRTANDATLAVHDIAQQLAAVKDNDLRRLEVLLAPETRAAMHAACDRPFATRHPVAMPVEADRLAARYASWYELFPRSQSGDPLRHGTFDDVIARLPAVREMGFDVLYFPPIHPIGQANRKGRNNSLNAGSDEPGSPYAIGAEDGGHDAIHAQLGTFDDFRRLCTAAAEAGLEIALDFAIQCSPDHPWLKQHPEWFAHRPDGSLRYAENPPKKYEDIVNVDFYAKGSAAPALWIALRDVVMFWAAHGVRLFRVDNPHTKPLPFWEWMIADVRTTYPDVIFLSEAFTRPKMMARLAKVGFAQSYTYFTWRNHKQELTDYMTELTQGPLREIFRPHFFVNTPDINPHFLHHGGRPAFLIRAALAATLSSLWGMLSGFELCESAPLVINGVAREEFLDSEKYQLRAREWDAPGNILREITRLNAIRANHPALQNHLGVRFCHADSDAVLAYCRHVPDSGTEQNRLGDDVLLVAVSLDPHAPHDCRIEVPLWEWGLPDDGVLAVVDLMRGHHFEWRGKWQHIRLDPHVLPFGIWQISRKETV